MCNFNFYNQDTVELAKKYKTPLYIMSEDHILDRIHEIKKNFIFKYNNTWAVYAAKAFLTKEMARIIKREEFGMDVVSGGELYTAIGVDFPMSNIIFHGNGKTQDELLLAIDHNVGRIVVDSLDELDRLNQLAKAREKTINILFRITPGVIIETHKYIQTGQLDSKFGIPIIEDIIYQAIEKTIKNKNINLMGFHFHLGSQIHSNSPYLEAIKIVMNIILESKKRYSFNTYELNIGGGFGIKYRDTQMRKDIKYYLDPLMEYIDLFCKDNELDRPKIIIEPGRWIVGEAGITLYTVLSIKEIPGIRTFVSVDGGMNDNPRASLYNAKYEAIVANKLNEEKTHEYTIAGKCCESGDILIGDFKSPKIDIGDIIAVLSTGAYNYSMSSNYNRIPKPPVIMIKDGIPRVIVRRETYEDIYSRDV